MATVIDIKTGRDGYHEILNLIRRDGLMRAPRGFPTRDLGYTTIVMSPYDALPLDCGRKLSPAVAAIEALQLISGTMNETLLVRVAPHFADFTEPDGHFHGAYGRRVGVQLAHVVRKLTEDRDTRQAVITLWDPVLDNLPKKRDYPCTVALHFSIVENRLLLNTTMRSNDVMLGFPYDIFAFTQLQLTIAKVLNIYPGEYTHTAWSLHLYEKDVNEVDLITAPKRDRFLPAGIGSSVIRSGAESNSNLIFVETVAKLLLTGGDAHDADERWFHEQLAPFAPFVG